MKQEVIEEHLSLIGTYLNITRHCFKPYMTRKEYLNFLLSPTLTVTSFLFYLVPLLFLQYVSTIFMFFLPDSV